VCSSDLYDRAIQLDFSSVGFGTPPSNKFVAKLLMKGRNTWKIDI